MLDDLIEIYRSRNICTAYIFRCVTLLLLLLLFVAAAAAAAAFPVLSG